MSLAVPNSAYAAFDLEYDGPALQAHEMDVRTLAPALLSVGDLFQELGRLTRPSDPAVNVNVRATSEGSFLIELRVIYETAKHVLSLQDTIAIATLGTLVTTAGNVISLLRRGPVQSEEPSEEPGLVRLTFSQAADATTLEVPQAVLEASRSVTIRRSVAELVQPLSREGIETLTLRQDSAVIATVHRTELSAFEFTEDLPARQLLATRDREVYLTILTAGFESGRWRFSDGQSTFTARVTDESFLRRVEGGEAFSKLDVLRCLVREQQWRDSKGLHQDVELTGVLEHLPAPEPGQLFDPDGPPSMPAA